MKEGREEGDEGVKGEGEERVKEEGETRQKRGEKKGGRRRGEEEI